MLVLGDAHADEPDRRAALRSAYREADADTALQVGDLGYYDLPTPTWFVAGNNEDLETIESLRRGEQSEEVSNAHLLASTAVELGGLRVAGLSGNFAPTQYEKSRAELSDDRRRHFTHEDVADAMALDSVYVLLAHEPPKGIISRGYDPGREQVDRLIDALEPDLCLVGHHHQHAEGSVGDTQVVSLAPVWESFYLLDPESMELTRHTTP